MTPPHISLTHIIALFRRLVNCPCSHHRYMPSMNLSVIIGYLTVFLNRFDTYLKMNATESLQRPAPLSYCCYVRQAMALSCHTPCSHEIKNTSQSKEETDNMLTDKTEQVTSGMKQSLSFQILSFLKEIQTINIVCGSLMCRVRSL